jgi:hypothetical protein
LKVVNRSLLSIAAHKDEKGRKSLVTRSFALSFKEFKIEFVPAPKRPTGTSGRPCAKPLFNSWGHLGLPDILITSDDLPAPLPVVAPATVALNNAIPTDSYAVWTAEDLTLATMKNILHKMTLPADYEFPSLSAHKMVNDTYDWVKAKYDANKPIHHLALLIAIVISSTILPDVFCSQNQEALFIDALLKEEVRHIYHQMDWITKPHNGLKKRTIFVSMFTTYIIALYEKDSPLRISMESNTKGGQGDAWRDKHSKSKPEFFLLLSTPSFAPSHSISTGAKGVCYSTLIRIGILWGVGKGAYKKGKFGMHWGLHSRKGCEAIYKALRAKLASGTFGPYDALDLLIGERNARVFCLLKRNDFSVRPPTLPSPDDAAQNTYVVDRLSRMGV